MAARLCDANILREVGLAILAPRLDQEEPV